VAQEMQAGKAAAAAGKASTAGSVPATRPEHWTRPLDASALVEYVTLLDISAANSALTRIRGYSSMCSVFELAKCHL